MLPDERDAAYLWDMLDAAEAVRQFVENRTFHEYVSNRMLRGAVERHVEIIGEAAGKVSEPFRQAHPEIPWRRIIANGMCWPMNMVRSSESSCGKWQRSTFPI